MQSKLSLIQRLIRYSFYAIFFLVPLVMFPKTYELFEFNKMWLVFAISILIFFLWSTKMILQGKFEIRRTPLDIPIALFLVSQIISTIFSMDPHTSIWGFYSRFNGGLLSTIAYIFLYYAFVSNLVNPDHKHESIKALESYKILFVSLASGLVVTLWGLPSHFGYDPTCLLFRGTLDVSCWTEAFQPTVRIFSTLGQPNWMGTFLAILIPVAVGFGIINIKKGANKKPLIERKELIIPSLFFGLVFLFYLSLLYTRSQSSFVGLVSGIIFFFAFLIFLEFKGKKIASLIQNKLFRYIGAVIVIFAVITFFTGSPIPSLNKYFSADSLSQIFNKPKAVQRVSTNPAISNQLPQLESGGTESSKIRLIVWSGAIELFKKYPLFGTGVETYAYSYYLVKPLAHNLTSEWDYLYNKAHNEYLNYLATTGAFGFLTYMSIIFAFFYLAIKPILKKEAKLNPLSLALLGSYIAILVSNFFGFSVVIINLFFFFIPIFFFELQSPQSFSKVIAFAPSNSGSSEIGMGKMTGIFILALASLYYEFYLLNFWLADQKYALGYNLDKTAEFTQAFTPLSEAVKMVPSEDLYKDELSINMATLALLLHQQNQSTQAAQFAKEAKNLSDQIVAAHPNNIVYYKTRTRVLYALSQLDPALLNSAIDAIKKAQNLAPTDAKIAYNMALFYNQKGDYQKTVDLLNYSIKLKPNYVDAYYALGLFYSQIAKDNPDKAVEYRQKAKENLEIILKNYDPNNGPAKELLKTLE